MRRSPRPARQQARDSEMSQPPVMADQPLWKSWRGCALAQVHVASLRIRYLHFRQLLCLAGIQSDRTKRRLRFESIREFHHQHFDTRGFLAQVSVH